MCCDDPLPTVVRACLCRWHPRVLRWCLLFYTRCNTGAWDELSEVLHLPSGRTLQGYRNTLRKAGVNEEALARFALKLRTHHAVQAKSLEDTHAAQLAELRSDQIVITDDRPGPIAETPDETTTGHDAQVQVVRAIHAVEMRDLLRKQEWDWKGCLAFDSMTIRKSFLWNAQTKTVEGFEDLQGVCESEGSLDGRATEKQLRFECEL